MSYNYFYVQIYIFNNPTLSRTGPITNLYNLKGVERPLCS